MSWVILLWNAVMVVFIIAGLAANAHTNFKCGQPVGFQSTCNDVVNTTAVVIIVVAWLVGDGILGLIWLVTKGNRRKCPVCGLPVRAGELQCKKCGFDFRATSAVVHAAATAPPSSIPPTVPPGWFPDPQGPGQLRFWDGYQWTAATRPSV
jgi:hypothetical protein